MSSEMREIKAMADAVEYGIALGKLDAPAVFTKMRDLLNLALLARTEAAPVADGAVAYQHREAGTEKWYDCSKEYYDTLQKHPWDRATMRRQELRALYTHPQDASGDAVTEADIVELVAGPYKYHHKMDDQAEREGKAFDRCRELTIQKIRTYFATRKACDAAMRQEGE